jgi:hypothetical protein
MGVDHVLQDGAEVVEGAVVERGGRVAGGVTSGQQAPVAVSQAGSQVQAQ